MTVEWDPWKLELTFDTYLTEVMSHFQVSINVEISFFEIYNEKIHDLLAQGNTSKVAPGKKLNVSGTFRDVIFQIFQEFLIFTNLNCR